MLKDNQLNKNFSISILEHRNQLETIDSQRIFILKHGNMTKKKSISLKKLNKKANQNQKKCKETPHNKERGELLFEILIKNSWSSIEIF